MKTFICQYRQQTITSKKTDKNNRWTNYVHIHPYIDLRSSFNLTVPVYVLHRNLYQINKLLQNDINLILNCR